MTYDIVKFEASHPSFAHANGLYALINIKGEEVEICDLNDDGTLNTHNDGSLSLSTTNRSNLYPTGLTIVYNGQTSGSFRIQERKHSSNIIEKLVDGRWIPYIAPLVKKEDGDKITAEMFSYLVKVK